MFSLKHIISTTVVKKIIMGLSGLALVGFIIVHLLGNLSLYLSDGNPFNTYVKKLKDLEILVVIAEVILFLIFATHIITGILITRKNKKDARPVQYEVLTSKGTPTSNFFSRTMPITGIILFLFLLIHLKQFTFGPGIEAGYVTTIDGEQARDLHKLVMETFKQPLNVAFYMIVMILLGFHLRHGFWSAFQSLGIMNRSLTNIIYGFALFFALILALGFLCIPLWIYLFIPGAGV